MIDWIIEKLENLKQFNNARTEKRRQARIDKLMLKLYREDALFKVSVANLGYLQDADKQRGVTSRWIVEFTGSYLGSREESNERL